MHLSKVDEIPDIKPISLLNGQKLSFGTPLIMGVINITPDSFYDGGRFASADAAIKQAEKLITEGADILDLGACSTRPNADDIGEAEELNACYLFWSIL